MVSLARVLLVAAQSGGGAREGKPQKIWEKFPRKWEDAMADVDDPYLAV